MSIWQTKLRIPWSFLQIFLASATTHWQFPASEGKHELRCVPPQLRSLSPCKLHKISRAEKTKSFSGTCQLWFINKTVSYLHYSTWKEKVLRCQYLFLLEEITRFMQYMPLKESHAWLKCLLSEMENGFGEAYSSKSALRAVMLFGGHKDNQKGVCAFLNCNNRMCNFLCFFTAGLLL